MEAPFCVMSSIRLLPTVTESEFFETWREYHLAMLGLPGYGGASLLRGLDTPTYLLVETYQSAAARDDVSNALVALTGTGQALWQIAWRLIQMFEVVGPPSTYETIATADPSEVSPSIGR